MGHCRGGRQFRRVETSAVAPASAAPAFAIPFGRAGRAAQLQVHSKSTRAHRGCCRGMRSLQPIVFSPTLGLATVCARDDRTPQPASRPLVRRVPTVCYRGAHLASGKRARHKNKFCAVCENAPLSFPSSPHQRFGVPTHALEGARPDKRFGLIDRIKRIAHS